MMKKCGIPLTVKHYLSLAYFGDITGLDQVGPEDRVEIDELIEDGILVDTESEYAN
jgi:hypothetical protein